MCSGVVCVVYGVIVVVGCVCVWRVWYEVCVCGCGCMFGDMCISVHVACGMRGLCVYGHACVWSYAWFCVSVCVCVCDEYGMRYVCVLWQVQHSVCVCVVVCVW